MPLAPGNSLLNYRLAETIGEGGMGGVWKATGRKDFVTPEGIRVAPALQLLKDLV